MTRRTNERVTYHNGEVRPESRVLVSFRDRGFKFGEAVFDTARTIRHEPVKLVEHVDTFDEVAGDFRRRCPPGSSIGPGRHVVPSSGSAR